MDKLKNSLIGLVGLAVLAGGIIAITTATGQGQGGTLGKDVNVVNTPTVLAQQSGTWDVGITGTPNIRDLDEPARQPYQRTGGLDFAAGQDITTTEFTVPANKRLVIEYVSAQIIVAEPIFWFSVKTTAGSAQGTHFFAPMALPNVAGLHIVSQQTRLYANPGSTVTIEARRYNDLDLDARSGRTGFSGYLVDP